MAADKLIDSGKLDACLESEADTIRSKTGGSADITFDFSGETGFSEAMADLLKPSGSKNITTNGTVDVSTFASAIVNVPMARVATGTASTSRTSTGTATCGFAPDFVFWREPDPGTYQPDICYSGVAFTQNTSNVGCIYDVDDVNVYYAYFNRTSNGFTFTAIANESRTSLTINYTAVKYTS